MIEEASPFRVRGWAFDKSNPNLALDLVLRVDGIAIDWFRPNFRKPAIADFLNWSHESLGVVGFDLRLPAWLADGQSHTIDVIHSDTGHVLSPGILRVQHSLAHVEFCSFVECAEVTRLDSNSLLKQTTVIVLNRNGANVLGPLLESWASHNRVPSDWIVIDHASSDESLALLGQWQSKMSLRVIALDRNDSFSASCNRAIALAQTPYVLLLNNDIVWLQDALAGMLKTMQDTAVGAVGLKLLKTLSGTSAYTTVQHLGVRYRQIDDGYWPYEVTPTENENEHSPQFVPAATAAALMCRREDLLAIGGFDEDYFYGFEDVDLCLRLEHQLGLLTVCRNDLVALHRHGYSRLTGREGHSQFTRIVNNANVLGQKMGLWAKYQWWKSLLSADHMMCAETLTIGLVVKTAFPASTTTQSLARQILAHHKRAKVVFVHPGIDYYDARDLHILVVDSFSYDTRSLKNARPDLVLIALVRGAPESWVKQPWWMSFTAYLTTKQQSADNLARLSPVSASLTSKAEPLGYSLHPEAWPLRVGIEWDDQNEAQLEHAKDLQIGLKRAGVACWLLPLDPGPAGRRVLDVRVRICNKSKISVPPTAPIGTLNILWCLSSVEAKAQRSQKRGATNSRHWIETHLQPTAQFLQQHWKAQIEHTFSAS
ncbi:MAG: hypothetical protein CFE39_05400 [Comamonadaceae bacterium PBBC2]|nr:MAG: hypothetical protein CFE39_05400 [Comamonadaceae bacterium PBBC2]